MNLLVIGSGGREHAMAWRLAQVLPNCEAHLVPGGHFVAIEIADQVIGRLDRQLREAG